MTLKDILEKKGSAVFSIPPDATFKHITEELTHHNVGSLVVCERDVVEGERLLGIVTERDILRLCAKGTCSSPGLTAADIMTTKLITASPTDAVEKIMGLMTKNRIRHLPVLSEGRLIGMVSIGDVVKAQHDRLAMENQFMKDYIQS
ncbi:MAG: CBS domain-containing protein [Planctomycetota bacterium]|jgi:CBS domain-containing protein